MSISEAIIYSYWTFIVMAFFGSIIGGVIVAAMDAQQAKEPKLAEQH
jgi:hypothetical protein